MKVRVIFIVLVLITQTACGQTNNPKNNLGFEYAKSQLKEALTNKTERQILADTLISDKETAIAISEAILFKIYGKENIIKQKPYEINKIDGHYIVNGTLSDNAIGGTFLIILNAKNSQVIKLTHGK